MENKHVVQEWMWATEDAIRALQTWLDSLREWRNGGEMQGGDFQMAHRALSAQGLETWADECKAGDGLDRLAEAVTGKS